MHSYSLTLRHAMRDGEGAARSLTRRAAAQLTRCTPLRPSGLTGGAMVRRAYRQRSLVEVLLPDADKLWDSTLREIDSLLDDDVLVDRVAEALAERHPQSRRRGRLRVDTTVVETNIHYPTDATLLADGVRVLTRSLRRIGERVRERTRSVARRVFEIAQRSRTAGSRVRPRVREQSQAKMKVLYQGLMRITRAVVRQAEAALARARTRHHAAQLPTMVELIRQVLAQTRARVLRGDTRYPGKVVSLFEPHTEIIRKGKLAKPTEFGRLVKIQEAEAH